MEFAIDRGFEKLGVLDESIGLLLEFLRVILSFRLPKMLRSMVLRRESKGWWVEEVAGSITESGMVDVAIACYEEFLFVWQLVDFFLFVEGRERATCPWIKEI